VTAIAPIETRYAGCRFRSRLEARWAVFFDEMGISWQYEPQGFFVRDDKPYLPDFLLDECQTWIEVKGAESELDHDLMWAAAEQLPTGVPRGYPGPALMILGPIPPLPVAGDWFWMGLDPCVVRKPWPDAAPGVPEWLYPDARASRVASGRYAFGDYANDRRPNRMVDDDCDPDRITPPKGDWLTPVPDLDAYGERAAAAYKAARSARFEYGESGAS
jgi:hypothetical protein